MIYYIFLLLDLLNQLGIKIIRFDEVTYSKKYDKYGENLSADDKMSISGRELRNKFLQNKIPPKWMMRKEISQMILDRIRNGEEIFVN